MLDENEAESIKYEPLKIAILELFVVILAANEAESVWYVNGLPVIS